MTTAAITGLVWWVFALPISALGFVVGQLVSAGSHYWADRRFTLQRLCDRLGKGQVYRLGAPRDVKAQRYTRITGQEVVSLYQPPAGDRPEQIPWDNPSLGTGAYVLD